MNYLYGLSIQGIQSYIFATNKLKEIVGGSALVAELPRQIIEDIIGRPINENNLLVDAAGNFKYEFQQEDKDDLARVFLCVPKMFAERAGDITVSQAVIKTARTTQANINKLEQKLKEQRNVPKTHRNLGWMSMRRNPKTSTPAVGKDGDDFLDYNQTLKRNRAKDKADNKLTKIFAKNLSSGLSFTDNLEEITSDDYENWIGVIHADGNGLGKLIMTLTEKSNDIKKAFREFSENLQKATEAAVNRAFVETVGSAAGHADGKIPFRPIVIGGDDVTVLTRGDLALDFTNKYLQYFEEETKQKLDLRLTACAGIAYTKSHYPFHYGADLAEELCSVAKKTSKDISVAAPPSSLMFHRMQSSFVRSWEEITETELKAGDVRLNYGPYFTDKKSNSPQVTSLLTYAEKLSEPDAPKSAVRQWLSELAKDPIRAKDLLERSIEMTTTDYADVLDLHNAVTEDRKTHLYDAMVIEDLTNKKSQQ